MRLVRALLLCLLLAPSAAPVLACCGTAAASEACAAPEPCPTGACEACRPATPGTLPAHAASASAPARSAFEPVVSLAAIHRVPAGPRTPAAIPLYLRLSSLRN
jgi:hypothetical protein